MDWNEVEGKWEQLKGKVREQWGKLTDNDISIIKGKRDQLIGKIQERYGYAKDRAEKEVSSFTSSCGCGSAKNMKDSCSTNKAAHH